MACERYHARKAAGLCVYSSYCNNPPETGKTKCPIHLAKNRENQRKHANTRYKNRRAIGLCVESGCNSPPVLGKIHCQIHADKAREAKRRLRKKRKAAGFCTQSGCNNPIVAGKTQCQMHLDKLIERNRKTKIEVFNAYGGFKCDCPCGCKETNSKLLTIDHINNDGAKHRRELRSSGQAVYTWLKKNNYPPGFRVLCMNCNWGRGKNGGVCPHLAEQQCNDNPPSS